MMKVCLSVWLLLILSNHGFAQSDRVEHWQQDIDYYAEQMVARHIDPFSVLSESDFRAELKRIRSTLSHKTDNQILIDLMRLTRRIGDGHTAFPLWKETFERFPIRFKKIENTVRVIETTTEYAALLGATLISINGVSAAEAFKAMATVAPFTENPYSESISAASYLASAVALNGLGMIPNTQHAQFIFAINGKQQRIVMASDTNPKFTNALSHFNDNLFSPHEQINDDLWFGSTANHKTVYVKFRRYPSASDMSAFAEDLLEFINEHESKNLIIDLRDNYGGDFFVGLILAQPLVLADSIDWKSGVYTLIDGVTFSAAMSNAAQYTQILNSKLVGTPTGARPSGYQDMGQFQLPNSGHTVTYSKRLYHFKEDGKDALYPDHHVAITFKDYMNGYDRQLRWVLKTLDKPSEK